MTFSTTWKRWLCAGLCAALLFASPVFAAAPLIDSTDGEKMSDFLEQVLKVTEKQYRYDVTYQELLEHAVDALLLEHPELFSTLAKGAYSALDENSRYLTAEEFDDRYEQVEGEYAGIGVTLWESNGKVVFGATIPGSPATDSGLQPGDVLVSVDGQSVADFDVDKAISLIRGEAGTTVTLGIERNGQSMVLSVKRAVVKINPVSYELLGQNNAAYVSLSSFTAQTRVAFADAMADLASQGVDKIILDLRDNGGGYISAAIDVASYFIPDGALVVTETYKNEKKNIPHYANHEKNKFKLVLLVNGNSASASEIVAGAIRDHQAGELVGNTTFGKGTVQTSVVLKNNDAIWLTIAEYTLPKGESIHKKGINPQHIIGNRMVPADLSGLEPMDPSRIYSLGDQGPGVLALKQRLQVMGYYFEPMNDRFDDRTADVVSAFQNYAELYPYGVADITTQLRINDYASNALVEEDTQLDLAKRLIFQMK